MRMDPRRWKFGGGVWVIVGVAALAVVLALVIMMVPRAEVAARVNGEKILAEDVEQMKEQYQQSGMSITFDQALEQLIAKVLLLQAAEQQGHLITMEEADQKWQDQLAAANRTIEDFMAQLDLYGVSYDEYLEDYREHASIENYLTAAVPVDEVTEEEAREFYDDYAQQHPDEELPSFEDAKSGIIQMLEQERRQDAQVAMQLLIEDLREKANVKYG
jgi:parvulin-like peptidyl-prolyl isomerase